ncbi:MAG: hypothetical protein ACLP0J_29280, partial [Solirubrobacteraceae bacterium]
PERRQQSGGVLQECGAIVGGWGGDSLKGHRPAVASKPDTSERRHCREPDILYRRTYGLAHTAVSRAWSAYQRLRSILRRVV